MVSDTGTSRSTERRRPSDDDTSEPSRLERLRARYPWLDHAVRAGTRYQERKGDFYAAGITYFSVLSLIPVLMVAFAIAGFVLVGRPELLGELKTSIAENMPGGLGDTVGELVDSAIDSRSTVGVLGLLTAAYTGLGWMANLRDALTAMWTTAREKAGFVKTKLSDGINLIGLGIALILSLGLSALSTGPIADFVVEALNLEHVPGFGIGMRIVTLVASIAATTAVFAWVIARLPREPVTFRSALRAGLMMAIAFEILKQVGSIYLAKVTGGPAGAAFGPIIGVFVFFNLTFRLLLLCTAWAATAKVNLANAFVPPPDPAVIAPRVVVSEGPGPRAGVALLGVGALVGWLVSRLRRD